MLSHAITGFVIISSLLKVPLPIAIGADVYPVPTVKNASAEQMVATEEKTGDFEWRLLKKLHGEYNVPAPAKKSDSIDPIIQAKAAIIVDGRSQHVLWQKNPDEPLPIASITKLMTTLVWFDHQPLAGLEHIHTVAPEENRPLGKEIDLPLGTKISAQNLLHGSLIASNNDMMVALAHTTAIPDKQYIEFMNKKARALGMNQTTFADMTGLSSANRATIGDVARLARVAFWNKRVEEPAGQATHFQESADGAIRYQVVTTNHLLYEKDLEIIAGKTGYIPAAGYNLVVKVRVPESAGGTQEDYVIVAVLGTASDAARFEQAKRALDWAFQEYQWGNNNNRIVASSGE